MLSLCVSALLSLIWANLTFKSASEDFTAFDAFLCSLSEFVGPLAAAGCGMLALAPKDRELVLWRDGPRVSSF